MATWLELVAELREQLGATITKRDEVWLSWRSLQDGRAGTQRLCVLRSDAFAHETVIIVVPLFAEHALGPRAAIQYSAGLAVGAMLLHGEGYVLRAVMPLEQVTWPQLRFAVEYLAQEGHRLRLATLPRAAAVDMFDDYAL